MNSRTFLLPLAATALAACTAFYPPTEDDDGVKRCNTSEDCGEPDSNQHTFACVHGEGQDNGTDKVCTLDYDLDRNCLPEAYAMDSPLVEAYNDALSAGDAGAYAACTEDNFGKQGCTQDMIDGCDAGLSRNDITNVCDEEDPEHLAIMSNADYAGQDVLDQFCAWYFGDPNWVCNEQIGKCRPCEEVASIDGNTNPFSEGGCVRLYVQGAPSPVYDFDSANDGSDSTDDAVFGSVPEAP